MKTIITFLMFVSLGLAGQNEKLPGKSYNREIVIGTKTNICFIDIEQNIKDLIDSYHNTDLFEKSPMDYIEVFGDINGDLYIALKLVNLEPNAKYREIKDKIKVPEFYKQSRNGWVTPYTPHIGCLNYRLNPVLIDEMCWEDEVIHYFFREEDYCDEESEVPSADFIVRDIRAEYGSYLDNVKYLSADYYDIKFRVD